MDTMVPRKGGRFRRLLRRIFTPMRIALVVMIVVVLFVIGLIIIWPARHYMLPSIFGAPEQEERHYPVVSTTIARFEDWQPHLNVVGTLRPVNGSDLAFEVSGVVDKVFFDSGRDVKAGTPLVALRSADDVARLHTLEAAADLARTVYARAQKLFAIHAISKQELDQDLAQLHSAQAQVREQQAIVAKKMLRAPFAGHVGLRQVNVGQYVNAGVAVVTLQMLDPIYLDFTVPQQQLSSVHIGQAVNAQFDAYPDLAFTGQVTSIDPKADQSTRNVAVRAILANADRRLVPGMFARSSVNLGAPQHFLTLPQTAVTFNPFGQTVFVVVNQPAKGDEPAHLVAKQTFVTTGDTRGDQIQILSGIKDGDQIVTAGQIKLQTETPVEINNKVQPSSNPNPTPREQ